MRFSFGIRKFDIGDRQFHLNFIGCVCKEQCSVLLVDRRLGDWGLGGERVTWLLVGHLISSRP